MGQKSQGKSVSYAKRKAPEPPVPAPDWPTLQPLIPITDLILETLLEEQIIVIRNLFTSTLCKQLVSFLSQLPLTTTSVRPKAGEAVRVNDRLMFDDPAFAEQLWQSTALKELVTGSNERNDPGNAISDDLKKLWGGEVCGLNPRIRIYRYGPEQFFGQHLLLCTSLLENPPTILEILSWYMRLVFDPLSMLDGSYVTDPDNVAELAEGLFDNDRNGDEDWGDDEDDESNTIVLPTSPPSPAKTTWTLLIYLTGPATGCVGGETVFYPEFGSARQYSGKRTEGTEPVAVGLEVGMALLHRHGQDCLLHEGRKVTKGEKWVIRSDLCVRR